MSTEQIEVHYEDDDLIPAIEHCIERSLGYKKDIYNILCYPKNHAEVKCQKFVERIILIRGLRRIKEKEAEISHNQKAYDQVLLSPKGE